MAPRSSFFIMEKDLIFPSKWQKCPHPCGPRPSDTIMPLLLLLLPSFSHVRLCIRWTESHSNNTFEVYWTMIILQYAPNWDSDNTEYSWDKCYSQYIVPLYLSISHSLSPSLSILGIYIYIITYSTIVFFHTKNIVEVLAQYMSSSTYKCQIFLWKIWKIINLDASLWSSAEDV